MTRESPPPPGEGVLPAVSESTGSIPCVSQSSVCPGCRSNVGPAEGGLRAGPGSTEMARQGSAQHRVRCQGMGGAVQEGGDTPPNGEWRGLDDRVLARCKTLG